MRLIFLKGFVTKHYLCNLHCEFLQLVWGNDILEKSCMMEMFHWDTAPKSAVCILYDKIINYDN